MIIGTFTHDHNSDSYFGEIRTFSLHCPGVTIRPSGRNGDRDPDYRVVLEGEEGTVELGAAWKKTSERGQDYLSIVLDDPAFPARCDAALFLDKRENSATLVWTRPTRQNATPQPERPKAQARNRRAPRAAAPQA